MSPIRGKFVLDSEFHRCSHHFVTPDKVPDNRWADERSSQGEVIIDALTAGAIAGAQPVLTKAVRVLAAARPFLPGSLNLWNTSLANPLVRRGDNLPWPSSKQRDELRKPPSRLAQVLPARILC